MRMYTDSEEKMIKEALLALQQEIECCVEIIDNVAIKLEGEKLWDYSRELMIVKQKLLDLLMPEK